MLLTKSTMANITFVRAGTGVDKFMFDTVHSSRESLPAMSTKKGLCRRRVLLEFVFFREVKERDVR